MHAGRDLQPKTCTLASMSIPMVCMQVSGSRVLKKQKLVNWKCLTILMALLTKTVKYLNYFPKVWLITITRSEWWWLIVIWWNVSFVSLSYVHAPTTVPTVEDRRPCGRRSRAQTQWCESPDGRRGRRGTAKISDKSESVNMVAVIGLPIVGL